MRFMVIVKASKQSEAGILPTSEQFAEMGKFNEELAKAGALLAADGLQPSSKGVRISFAGSKPSITDGPFAETKELIAGFWLLQFKSKEEAIEWMLRSPFGRPPFNEGEIEIRQVYEAEDFGEALTPQLREQEERLRARTGAN